MNKLYRFLILAGIVCLSNVMVAQQRTEEDAMKIASEFLTTNNFGAAESNTNAGGIKKVALKRVNQQAIRKSIRRAQAKADNSSNELGFYIFNDETTNRFVIVSADERMVTILGYSDNSLFDAENIPDGLKDMLCEYHEKYSILQHTPLLTIQESKKQISPSYQNIAPLITAEWGQDSPFNDQCPTYTTDTIINKCATGCVATAMAQIINYWKYPINGKGQYSYTTSKLSIPQTFDFETLNMDYDKLRDNYSVKDSEYDFYSTDEERVEVAKLMHACGVAVNMDYNESSSAANTDVAYALINHFGYNPNITNKYRMFYSDEEWNKMIIDELENKRPILYSGASEDYGGHAFILDGCDKNGLYHFNFGWTLNYNGLNVAIANGYYSIDAIKPTSSVWLLSNFNFEISQGMICNITPSFSGIHEDNVFGGEFLLPDTTITHDDNVNYEIDVLCVASSTTHYGHPDAIFKGKIGVGLFDEQFNIIKSLYDTIYESRATASTEDEYSSLIKLDTIGLQQDNIYYIAAFVQGDNSSIPTRIRTYEAQTDYYIFFYDSDSIYIKTEADRNLTIINEVAGELSQKISPKQLPIVKSLTISGPLNGIDILYLQDIFSNYKIVSLDISDCQIIDGKDGMKTSNNAIYNNMFSNMKYLTTLILPKTVEGIANSIHRNPNLEYIVLPEQLKYFGSLDPVFENCPKLKALNISSENNNFKTIDGILYTHEIDTLMKYPSGRSEKNFTTPSTVKVLWPYSLSETLLKKITFTDVKKIFGCQTNIMLQEIELSSSIEYISWEGFHGCYNLNHIICHISDTTAINNANLQFDLWIPSTCLWSVPKGTANCYKSQKWWRDSWRIEETLENPNSSKNDNTAIENYTYKTIEVNYVGNYINVISREDGILQIYDLNGSLVYHTYMYQNQPKQIPLPKGIYIINGNKYIVK